MKKPGMRIVVTGDICPNEGLDSELLGPDGARYLEAVAPLLDRADLVIGNLETPLCDQSTAIPKTGPNFMCDPALAAMLKAQGFDGFALANNHILDQGVEGLDQSLRVLDAAGLPYCGAGLTHEAACRPAVFTRGDDTIGVFNFAEGEFAQSQGDGPGTARLDAFWSEERVRRARTQFDIILVVLHIGNEYQPIPSGVSMDFCRRMIAAGADAVVAHHAHIPQGTERFQDKPIAYNVGNFLFGYPLDADVGSRFDTTPCWFLSTVAELCVNPDGRIDLALHPFKQQADRTLAPLSVPGRKAFDAYIKACNAILLDAARQKKLWEQEARNLFSAHWEPFARSVDAFSDPDPAKSHRAATLLFNFFRCEAHHEMLRRGFQLAYERRQSDDRDAQQAIDSLLLQLRACFD